MKMLLGWNSWLFLYPNHSWRGCVSQPAVRVPAPHLPGQNAATHHSTLFVIAEFPIDISMLELEIKVCICRHSLVLRLLHHQPRCQ